MLSVLSLKEGLPVGRPSRQTLPLGQWLGSLGAVLGGGQRAALRGEASETPFQALGFGLRGYNCSLEIIDLQ